MTYKEVVQWLFAQLPNYQKQGGTAYKPGLETITGLLAAIGNPHQRIKTIHIAGTNGKGSVSHILAAIFQAHGYKVGLFTSPHINDFRERIKINGELVSERFVIDFYEKFSEEFKTLEPTFFEITTAMAFQAFATENCDISIIETGLGGRLDSTNVLIPELSVITNIALDHTKFLGDTIVKIAYEKAGIIKENVPVVIGDMNPEVLPVFEEIAEKRRARIHLSGAEEGSTYKTDLLGDYQQKNIRTALASIDVMIERGWRLEVEKVKKALTEIVKRTNFRGRLQKIAEKPLTIVDAGHNPEGMKKLIQEVKSFEFDTLRIVYGASNDKNISEIINLFPKEAIYYFSEFSSPRTVKKEDFEKMAGANKLNFKLFEDPVLAVEKCREDAVENDLILVCGSFYILEKII